jgi:RNA polymerase sigma-70 factor (ECF subfamily)
VCQHSNPASGLGAVGIERARHAQLVAALSRLTPRCRAAFVLTSIVGLSYAEAATVCHCRVSTIRRRVARARSDLIRALAPQ